MTASLGERGDVIDHLSRPNYDFYHHAFVLASQGKYDDAVPLLRHSYAILEETLGPQHPQVAESLNNLALLLKLQVTWYRSKYFDFTKQCLKRQQGCLQCYRASCRIGVESTAEVVHKSAVATRCASEQKENIERCRLLLTDSQSQVCLGDEKE